MMREYLNLKLTPTFFNNNLIIIIFYSNYHLVVTKQYPYRSSAMVESILFDLDFKKASSLFLKALIVFEFMTTSGSSFQADTILLLRKFSLGVQSLVKFFTSLCFAPRMLLAGPCEQRDGVGILGLTKLTILYPLIILKYCIKSPFFRRSSSVVSPSAASRCS